MNIVALFPFFVLRFVQVFFIILYIIIGVVVFIAYFFLQSMSEKDQLKAREWRDENKVLIKPKDDDNLNLEYETLNKNVDERGNQTLLSGSIILVASFLIMLEALRLDPNSIVLLPFVILISILLYGYWLTLFASTRKLDSICFERMRAIEKIKGIQVHRLLYKTQKKPEYQFGRLLYMQVIFGILILFGIIILLLRF